MRFTPPVFSAVIFATIAAVVCACESHGALRPTGAGTPAAGAAGAGTPEPTGASSTGSAGASSTGAAGASSTGAAGATGTAGASSTGAAGTSTPPGPTPLAITGVEAITRIASLLWHAAPDGDVLARAQAGQFETAADLVPAVLEMLADPRAAAGVNAFYRWWLELDDVATTMKDQQLFPAYTPELQADMADETESFAVDVTLLRNGTYGMLLTSPISFVNADLASLYGVAGVDGDDLRRIDLDPTQRTGLLTQAALQVLGSYPTRNSPSHRGSYVAQKFFCEAIPAAPAAIGPLESQPGVTLRQTLAQDLTSPTCAACHSIIDPLGLAFETFDAIGRWRTTDNGAPVDVSGLALPSRYSDQDTDTPFSGPIELANLIASSSQAQQCMVEQWMSFVLSSSPQALPIGSWRPAEAAFINSGFNLKTLIAAVLTSDAFLAAVNP